MKRVKVVDQVSSPSMSFQGFNVVKLLKGQRKTVVALIGAVLGYLLTNNEIITLMSGLLFEVLVETAIYFKNKY